MKFHIIIDHPWDKSFNFRILQAFSEGLKSKQHEMDILDLNKDHFNPVMTPDELALYSRGRFLDPKVKDYQDRLRKADHLVLIFPIWWMIMPAALKGWMDKVLLPGFAFSTDQFPKPLLNSMHGATILTTTATSDAHHRLEFNNALEWVLCKGTLKFCGINPVEWLNFGDTGFASQEKHIEWLDYVKKYAEKF